jgi:WD40 repeat protein/energy-coupling factor transporter ATP-binding protein EcfA2
MIVAHVFISYATPDRAVADEVVGWLRAVGHGPFLAHDLRHGISVGEDWEQRLYEELRRVDAVIGVVTSSFLASTWCLAEVAVARALGCRLMPLSVEADVVHPLMQRLQSVDYWADPQQARRRVLQAVGLLDGGGPKWCEGENPFPGLQPFTAALSRVFFGRVDEAREVGNRLRAMGSAGGMLVVVGPSGCGKSSLLNAAVVPLFDSDPDWLTVPSLAPGHDPLPELARVLAATAIRLGLRWSTSELRGRLEADTDGLRRVADDLLAASLAPSRRLLVSIDQAEELFTRTASHARERFARLLRDSMTGPVHVITTMRSEFLDQLLVDDDLAVLPTHTYTLRPLHREALRTVIESPAQLAGIDVHKDLVAQLVTDTDSGEALPLLAFTLAQLAEGVTRGGQLSWQRYKELGGVQGALARQADEALTEAIAASGRRREEVIAGLLRLVTVDEQGRPTRWRVSRDKLPKPVIRELNAFVQRRLVTTDTANGSVVVGVVHEAFLSAWPPLAQAITENASTLRACRAVEQAAAEWNTEARPPARLWERGQLAAARADIGAYLHAHDLITDRVDLSPTARDFLRAGIRRDRLRRGRTITILSVLLILAVVAAAIAVVAQRTAARERNVAVSQKVAAQALALRAINPALAAQLGLAAYRLTPTADARGSLLSIVANPDVTRLTGHTNAVKGVAISPDGHILATGSDDKTVRLWDISVPHDPRLLSILRGHTNYIPRVAFSPDGHILATASDDKTAGLWDVRDPRRPSLLGTLTGHTGVVYWVAFSPDGNTVATASEDTTARLWDVRDPHHPNPLGTLTSNNGGVSSVAFSPDGHTLASSDYGDKNPRLWDVRDLHHPIALGTLLGHSGGVSAVTFSPDGHTLATTSYDDGTARLWDVRDLHHPIALGTLLGHSGGVSSAAFSPDGHTLATSSQDTTARLWDVGDPSQPRLLDTLTGHANMVYSVAFSPDGHTLATGSYDNTARLWSLSGPVMKDHTNTVSSAAFSPDGRTLATASYDGTARLWDVGDARQPYPLATFTDHTGGVSSVTFRSDDRIMATGSSDDKTARLWDIRDPHSPLPLATFTGHESGVFWVALSPDGHTLATAGQDTTVRLGDVGDPHQPSLLTTLKDHTDIVYAVAFSPDGRTLASASGDHTARLWNVRDPAHPRPLATLTDHSDIVYSVTFSPDGHTLATASADNTARLWNIRDLHHPSPLGVLTGHTSSVNAVTFSPDGRTVATASADNTARLWNIRDLHHPSPLGTLTAHTSSVKSVAFSPEGHTLATASADSTARLWETNLDSVTTRICKTTPTITPLEWNQYLPHLPYQPPCPRAS